MRTKTVISLEQALTLPYCTQRFVQLGWRVIRLESKASGGDPNRYIGNYIGFDDIHSYFIAPNIGKESITLNLKLTEGRQLLLKLINELKVDIFMCNTLPMRYKQLGIDFETLKAANPDLIWCGISAFGIDYPDVAGYDPALQAMLGCMHLTGEPDRDPMLCGLPIVDLKAGDEAFIQVLLALLEQSNSSKNKPEQSNGKEIHISMARTFSSWLITALPELVLNPNESDKFKRSGNEHRSFIPCNCYPTRDGFVYLAIGSDSQWEKLTRIKGFEHIAKPERKTNTQRKKDKNQIYSDIRQGTILYTTDEILNLFKKNNLAAAPVNTLQEVAQLDFIRNNYVKTNFPDGKIIKLFPAPVNTEFLNKKENTLNFTPKLGEHNFKIYTEIGLSEAQINKLILDGVI